MPKRKYETATKESPSPASLSKRLKNVNESTSKSSVLSSSPSEGSEDGVSGSHSSTSDEDPEVNVNEDTSSSGSSSSESEEESSSLDEVIQLPRKGKPSMKPPNPSSLEARLSSFLPAMEKANADLQGDLAVVGGEGANRKLEIDADGDEGPYIEMNLGLGVLEKRTGDEVNSDSSSTNESEEDGTLGGPKDVIAKLMKSKPSRPTIQEVEPA